MPSLPASIEGEGESPRPISLSTGLSLPDGHFQSVYQTDKKIILILKNDEIKFIVFFKWEIQSGILNAKRVFSNTGFLNCLFPPVPSISPPDPSPPLALGVLYFVQDVFGK